MNGEKEKRVKRREKRELKCGGKTETEMARQKRKKVKKRCSGWLESGGVGWGRGCRVKGWWGSEVRWRRQTLKQRGSKTAGEVKGAS